ncbi:MAG: hypothetical protein HKN94_09280 [Acidimicrobiales bacterium]|nr:hypothetical protein [Acidimicrobiales bacterium]RZV45776.1 MAG: hypothetical protein EX269_09000 [Acidimicrobiales bacterium]
MASADDTPQVQIVWVDGDGQGRAPAAPTGNEPGQPKGQAVVAIVSLVVLIGVLWLAARPDTGFSAANERIITPPPTTVAEVDEEGATPITAEPTTEVDVVDDAMALGGPIRQPVRVNDGWRALRETPIGTDLVQSDDGLTWTSSGAGLPPGAILAMGAEGDELAAIVITEPTGQPGYDAQLWRSSDAGLVWFPDQTAPSLTSDGNIYRGALNGAGAVVETAEVVRDRQPDEIGDVLVSFVPEEEARNVCEIAATFEANDAGYAFNRCGDGETVFSITESEIHTQTASFGVSECLELLGFAMRSQARISVMQPGQEAVTLELPPFLFASDVMPTADGLVAVLVDYRYFSPLVGPCLPLRQSISSGVYTWSGGEFERNMSLPDHDLVDYFGATLSRFGDDGSLLLAASEGGFVLAAGADDWELVVEREVGGGSMEASADGAIVMNRNRNDEIWLTRSEPWLEGAGSWQKVDPTDSTFASLLLGNDEGAVLTIENLLGVELMQVPLD